MAKMPWVTISWHSFLILCCEDQTFNELNCDHAKAQGYSAPWNLEQGALQGEVTFTLLMGFPIWKLIEQQSHTVPSMGQQQQLLKTYHSLSNAVLCIFCCFQFKFHFLQSWTELLWVLSAIHCSWVTGKVFSLWSLRSWICELLLQGLGQTCFKQGLLCY